MPSRVQTVDTKPISFRPTSAQRARIETVAQQLGSPGRLGTAIRWMLENAPEVVKTEGNGNVAVNRK